MQWTHRAYSRADAAERLGLTVNHLDVLTHRLKGIETLFSGKEGRSRVFSLQDICILKIAHTLERFGEPWLAAVSDAFEWLQSVPAADAVLICTIGRSLPKPRRIIPDRDIARLPVDEATLLIPIGKIVAGIIERCDAIEKEAA